MLFGLAKRLDCVAELKDLVDAEAKETNHDDSGEKRQKASDGKDLERTTGEESNGFKAFYRAQKTKNKEKGSILSKDVLKDKAKKKWMGMSDDLKQKWEDSV